MKIKPNMGTLDRTFRAIVGIILLTIGPLTNVLDLNTITLTAMGLLGALALFSSISAYCPLYNFTDSNTLNKKQG